MLGRLVALLRSPAVRAGFVALALGACVWAVAVQWEAVTTAVTAIPGGVLVGTACLSLLYVVLTMLSWRAVLANLGSRLPLRAASSVFFVSQIGKYLPGGVWNILAAAEMGADHRVPRRRSVSVMVVSILISIVTGLALAVLAVVLGPSEAADSYGWVAWALPVVLVVLAPPVLNRLLSLALRLTRRPALEQPMTVAGTAAAALWALLAWLVAGAQVWLLATAVGIDATGATFALAVGGYALAWTVGFLVIVVPAGVGAREAALGVVLAGQLDTAGVVVVVLLSRLLLTVADLALGGCGLLLARTSQRNAHGDGAAHTHDTRP